MAAYMSMFREWRPRELAVPSIVIGAGAVDAGMTAKVGLDPWPLSHRRLEVSGDHFSMVDEHSLKTAEALQRILAAPSPALVD
jgi:thioesterase domain-containing protein